MIGVAMSHGKLENTLYNLFEGKSTQVVKKIQILVRQIAEVLASPVYHVSVLLRRLRFLFNKLMNYEQATPLKTR